MLKDQKGFTLIEVLVALAILALLGVAVLSALTTSTKAAVLTDVKQTARNLAETQMEQIKSQTTIWHEGSPVISCPEGYDIEVVPSDAPERDMNLQKIEITVNYNDQPVFSVVDYKKY
jgi:type II secretion system protein I